MSAAWRRRFAWGVICWVVVFWRLGYVTLQDPDEAHYAELTGEMLHAGNWLVPLLDGRPFIDKPVLFHWLQGASVLLLGETEFAARLPSALAALGLFALTRWAGIALLGAEAGEWGALMFATIPATFALSSLALFDMTFTAFLFGAVACLLVAGKERRWRVELAGYALLTLAVMTKGPVALVLVALFIAGGLLLGRGSRARMANLHWQIGLPAVALAASPWFVWMYWRFGAEFVQGYILAGNLWYFTQPPVFSSRAVSHTYYARAFVGAFFPWSGIAVARAVDTLSSWRRRLREADAAGGAYVDERLLWLWVLLVIGFFSAARFKLDHYIYPAAPACCLLAALAWREAAKGGAGTWATRAIVFTLAALLIVTGGFAGVVLFDLNLNLPPIAVLLPNLFVVGGAALLFQAYRAGWRVPSTAVVLVTTMVGAYALLVVIGLPVLEQTRPTAIVARRLHRLGGPGTPVGIYRLERWRASVRYYLGRPVDRLETPDDVRTFLAIDRPVYVVMIRREYEQLLRLGLPVHMIMRRPAVTGTVGGGVLRKQRWGFLVVVTNVPRHSHRFEAGRP